MNWQIPPLPRTLGAGTRGTFSPPPCLSSSSLFFVPPIQRVVRKLPPEGTKFFQKRALGGEGGGGRKVFSLRSLPATALKKEGRICPGGKSEEEEGGKTKSCPTEIERATTTADFFLSFSSGAVAPVSCSP